MAIKKMQKINEQRIMDYVKKVINGFLSGVGFTSGLILIMFLVNESGILKTSATVLNKGASNNERLEAKTSLKKIRGNWKARYYRSRNKLRFKWA